jgi:hypothetical protein
MNACPNKPICHLSHLVDLVGNKRQYFFNLAKIKIVLFFVGPHNKFLQEKTLFHFVKIAFVWHLPFAVYPK